MLSAFLASTFLALQVTLTSEARAALEAGQAALAAKSLPAAYEHGLRAVEFAPRSSAALGLLLRASAGDADARTLWSHELAAVTGDAKGRFKVERELADALPPRDASIVELAVARAAAVDELAGLVASARKRADKEVDNVVFAHALSAIGRTIAWSSPALADANAAVFEPSFVVSSGARKNTLDALERKLSAALTSSDFPVAIELAVILRGIGAQSNFHDLAGPKAPDLSKTLASAESALARARQQTAAKSGAPLTVDELDSMDGDECDRFTRAHARFDAPGIAISPRGWYRIETTCGHATLLGTADSIEDHHDRLVGWYTTDPFANRPGLVRVLPEAAGLESEGAPFFWAGGFQSGDVTTVRLACGTIGGLGRVLTHELTHRFDGAIYPGLPAWLSEGRAVWTGAAYANITDSSFVERHALFGTIDDARYRGYGGRTELEKLVGGTIEDYRDNYVAGYALFVYLRSWFEEPNTTPLFAAQLDQFMKSRRNDKRDAFAGFCAHFCDGKEGRPKDFDAFAEGFGKFVNGFYWRNLAPWTERYVASPGDTHAAEIVLDEPTWTWSRARAEPWLGQDHARAAGHLLRKLGDDVGALNAFVWSLGVDERWNPVDASLREVLLTAGKRDAAWILGRDVERRGLPLESANGPAPFLARLPKVRGLLDTYAAAVRAYSADGRTFAAAAFAADHDALAGLLGVPLLAPSVKAPDLGARRFHPFDEPWRALAAHGWIEDGLTNYDQHRVRGLWCVDDRDQLHVGRSTPRAGTGTSDRETHAREAFTRSNAWLDAGRYALRFRFAPTTSYVSACVVLGYERRDRNARLHFSAGDYSYAIGDKDEPAELNSVNWSISGQYEREDALINPYTAGAKDFGTAVSGFDVELVVDGGALYVFIGDEMVGSYHTPDGEPLEGYVGFAASTGSYKISRLSVQRRDRSAAYADSPRVPAPIRLDRTRRIEFRDAVHRAIRGVPRSQQGTLCAWLPMPELGESGQFDVERALARVLERVYDFERLVTRRSLPTAVCLALPAALGDEFLQRVTTELDAKLLEDFGPRLKIVRYGAPTLAGYRAEIESGLAADAHQAWLLFLDSAGVLRVAESLHAGKRIEGRLERWIDVFRNR